MIKKNSIWVVTDIDGTFMDHNYDFSDALDTHSKAGIKDELSDIKSKHFPQRNIYVLLQFFNFPSRSLFICQVHFCFITSRKEASRFSKLLE